MPHLLCLAADMFFTDWTDMDIMTRMRNWDRKFKVLTSYPNVSVATSCCLIMHCNTAAANQQLHCAGTWDSRGVCTAAGQRGLANSSVEALLLQLGQT